MLNNILKYKIYLEMKKNKSIAWEKLREYLEGISKRKSSNIYSFVSKYCEVLNKVSREQILILIRNDALNKIDIYHINNISISYIDYLKNTIHYFYRQRLREVKNDKKR